MPICWTRPRCLPRRKASAPVTNISLTCRWPGLAIRCSRSRCTCMSGSPSTSRKSQTLRRDVREIGPTIALAPPRQWENALTEIMVRAADASPTKRRIFEFFRKVAERAQLCISERRPIPLGTRFLRGLGEFFVYGPVRDQLGLRRARVVYTGGAPLGVDVFRFFRAIGVNLKQVYGATELSGLCSVQPNSEVDPETVGRMLQG